MLQDRFPQQPMLDRALENIRRKIEITEVNTTPSANSGEVGDWRYYNNGSDWILCLKLPAGWYEIVLTSTT